MPQKPQPITKKMVKHAKEKRGHICCVPSSNDPEVFIRVSYGYQKLMTTKSSYTSRFCNIIVQASSSSSFPMRSIYGNEKDKHSKDDYSLSTLQLHNPIRSERCFCWRECTSAPLLTPRCQPKALLTGNMHVILLILFLRVHLLRFFFSLRMY